MISSLIQSSYEKEKLWDIFHPNKLVFGTKTDRPLEILKMLYQNESTPIIFTSLTGYEFVEDSEALIIATEWEQFLNCNWSKVKLRMKGSIVLDARNCLDAEIIRGERLQYLEVGKR